MNHQAIQEAREDEHEEVALSTALNSLKGLARTLTVEVSALESILAPDVDLGIDFYQRVRQFEINLIRLALLRTNGHQLRAARLLGLKRSTLNAKIKLYRINSHDETVTEDSAIQ